ncbi:TetR/AcrR family transcriptional regulator C-terminal domain-containing protein [Actinomadura bangladeshensis]|uniref:Tetracycline repressor TetR C-terminal domain-containing protein n=1 Tax=Actinomadura bangladeshensis TaxID=453573 RepID=A0A4R4PAT1_9ACTN|nr:TetR/AcrR family transcriptional regulator C-terminal domain-containing protein [Actinomadura bangladeshensis]TDC18097.1 hypothetical protein E1284_07190 [Actinomadura bangladeshensis]
MNPIAIVIPNIPGIRNTSVERHPPDDEAGRDGAHRQRFEALRAGELVGYVEGVARRYVNERRAEARTGVSNEQFWAAREPTLVKAMSSGDYPTMANMADNTFDFSSEQLFEFDLTRLHDGFAAHITPT